MQNVDQLAYHTVSCCVISTLFSIIVYPLVTTRCIYAACSHVRHTTTTTTTTASRPTDTRTSSVTWPLFAWPHLVVRPRLQKKKSKVGSSSSSSTSGFEFIRFVREGQMHIEDTFLPFDFYHHFDDIVACMGRRSSLRCWPTIGWMKRISWTV